jgi:hypothetical protein
MKPVKGLKEFWIFSCANCRSGSMKALYMGYTVSVTCSQSSSSSSSPGGSLGTILSPAVLLLCRTKIALQKEGSLHSHGSPCGTCGAPVLLGTRPALHRVPHVLLLVTSCRQVQSRCRNCRWPRC